MFTFPKWLRVFSNSSVFRKTHTFRCISSSYYRTFADTPKTDPTSKPPKQVTGTENEVRTRVRRARPSDVPRVLRFVREHARATWPGLAGPPAAPHLILCDYLSRALAQGHSMLAEQQEARQGWNQIRGVALATAVCPWDANMIDKWSRCLRCDKSKRLIQFQAHCLRAPALHDKYKVHMILQVILVISPESTKPDIIQNLANKVIKRGKEVGFQLIRFDVSSESLANILEDIQLKKEWQLLYDLAPENRLPREEDITQPQNSDNKTETTKGDKGYIAVYTAETRDSKNQVK